MHNLNFIVCRYSYGLCVWLSVANVYMNLFCWQDLDFIVHISLNKYIEHEYKRNDNMITDNIMYDQHCSS